MEVGLDRAQRLVQRLGDLLVGEPLLEAEEDGGAVLRPQAPDRPLQRPRQVAAAGGGLGVRGGGVDQHLRPVAAVLDPGFERHRVELLAARWSSAVLWAILKSQLENFRAGS